MVSSIPTKETYSCDKCPAVFSRLDKLKSHKEEAHELDLKCFAFKTVFTSFRSYKRNKEAKFGTDGLVKNTCEVCGEGFCNPRFLMKHKKKHRFTCDDCEDIFGRVRDLTIHKKRPNVTCNLCNLIFCNTKKLTSHNVQIHGRIPRDEASAEELNMV